jgi:hypothetical protein
MSARELKNCEDQGILRLLRRIDSQEYFQQGSWTADPGQAQTFHDVVEVAEACARYGLMDVELALRYDKAAADLFSVIIR